LSIEAIGLSEGASIGAPAAFAIEKPIVYYGTSITQGECACRAGMTHPAILARMLNIDFINLGWSGAGRGEQVMAGAVAEIDAACYVMDYCQNHTSPEALEEVYAPFLATIRDRRPQTPIICITPIFSTHAVYDGPALHDGRARIIRDAVAARVADGDAKISLVEGHDLLGPRDQDCLIDAVHPNTCGLLNMATALAPGVRGVLKL
jgi:hypothetical protein